MRLCLCVKFAADTPETTGCGSRGVDQEEGAVPMDSDNAAAEDGRRPREAPDLNPSGAKLKTLEKIA